MRITKDIYIEDLLDLLPASVQYLSSRGIKCLPCGEPIWGTFEQAAREKGFDDDQIEGFVTELNGMLGAKERWSEGERERGGEEAKE
jgi:methionine synthase II (cobalamin-independent)